MPGAYGHVGAELRDFAKDVANVQKLECLENVRFVRSVIHAYGPLFAIDGPYVSHGPSSLITVTSGRFLHSTAASLRAFILAYWASQMP